MNHLEQEHIRLDTLINVGEAEDINKIFGTFHMDLLCKRSFLIILIIIYLISGCSKQEASIAGYIEGEYTYIASGVAGTLFELLVSRGQFIEKGTLLYVLDPEPEKARVSVIKANIADLQAQVDFAKIQYERQKKLYPRNATAEADVDQAKSTYQSKMEQLASYQAQLIQTEWSLNQKTISAPVTGQVFDTFYRVGEKIPENHPVLAILAPKNIKAQFYIPEKELSKMKLNQKILFSCDSCSGKTEGIVSYISPEAEYTPPVIYSKDTRDKLVYLIRADISEDVAKHFHPGQPIDVYLSHE